MRIVVFTCNYPPLINPRSFRIEKFVKLNSGEHEILIITSPIDESIQNEKNVIRCGLQMNWDSAFRNSLKKYSFLRFLHKLIWPDDKILHPFLYLMNYLFKYRQKNDLIITVSNPFSSHLIGLVLKKIFKQRWTADIGDIYFGNQHFSFLSKFLERIILKSADHIVVNSNSLQEHFISHYNLSRDIFSVIPNGIHLNASKIKHIPSPIIRISFIGNTYPETREAITELNILIELAKMDLERKICIQLYGNQFYKVQLFAKKYPELVQIRFCKNELELMDAYSNTDILINFANKNNPGLPSKLEEYLATGLPILNFIYSKTDPSFIFLNNHKAYVHHVNLNSPDLKLLNYFIQQNNGKQQINPASQDEQIKNSWQTLFRS